MNLLNTPTVTVYYDENTKILEGRFVGYMLDEELLIILKKILDYIKEFRPEYWIANLKYKKVFNEAIQNYIAKEWVPQALEYGIKKMAIINSENDFGKIAQELTTQQILTIHKDINYAQFSEMEEARKWILN